MTTKECVILTGCLGGIGQGISKYLNSVRTDYDIYGLDIKNSNEIAIKREGIHEYFQCDLRNEKLMYKTIENIINNQRDGTICHLINNAGVMVNDPIVSPKWGSEYFAERIEMWENVIYINLKSCYILVLYFSNLLFSKRLKGSIINISSISANGNPGQSAYSATKGALRSLSKVWSKELAAIGIRSNTILPGFINTTATEAALSEKALKKRIFQTPLSRLGDVQEIASVTEILMRNEFLNGAEINVDGGLVI